MILIILLPAYAGTGVQAVGRDLCEDYIRLHVLANDDGEAAQALKLKVRDACLEAAQDLLKGCSSADAAWKLVQKNASMLADAARNEARLQGYFGNVAVQTGVFEFPDRQYGDVIVPAGDYRALRIIIGEGKGKNWWCVLYPSLCMPEEYEPGMQVEFYSSIAKWIRKVVGGNDT